MYVQVRVLMKTDIAKQTGGQRPELRITEDLRVLGLSSNLWKVGVYT